MSESLKVAVYGRPIKNTCVDEVVAFIQKLKSSVKLFVYQGFAESIALAEDPTVETFSGPDDFPAVDVLISIGGDGTLLDCVSLVKKSEIPVLGVNTGRLGFLAFTALDDSSKAIQDLLSGNYTIEKRSMLEARICGELPVMPSALNEVTVQKLDASMITVHAYIDGEFLGTYWADGVIVATPTGSTAYSLSIGGPIVTPQSSVFVVSPIASHNLNMRPLVVPESSELRLDVEARNGSFIWSLDNHRFNISTGSSILIKKSDAVMNFIKFEGSNFCMNLRSKLLWGADKRN